MKIRRLCVSSHWHTSTDQYRERQRARSKLRRRSLPLAVLIQRIIPCTQSQSALLFARKLDYDVDSQCLVVALILMRHIQSLGLFDQPVTPDLNEEHGEV